MEIHPLVMAYNMTPMEDKVRWMIAAGEQAKTTNQNQYAAFHFVEKDGGKPDFHGGPIVTVSPTGRTKLIDCLKCPKCGWSVSKGEKE